MIRIWSPERPLRNEPQASTCISAAQRRKRLSCSMIPRGTKELQSANQ